MDAESGCKEQQWSYSGNPGASLKDQVRFLIGDTEKRFPQLTDGEIEWTISANGDSPDLAAVECVNSLIAKYSRLADETVGKVNIQYSEIAKGLMSTRSMLQQRLLYTDAQPYAGGISKTDKVCNDLDGDRVPPLFSRNMLTTPGLHTGDEVPPNLFEGIDMPTPGGASG